MRVQDALLQQCEDQSSDLYKAIRWAENSIRRGEVSFTLSESEFKSLTNVHNQLVMLGYSAMIYSETSKSKRKIKVWW